MKTTRILVPHAIFYHVCCIISGFRGSIPSSCRPECSCENSMIKCDGSIPSNLPQHIEEVTLTDIKESDLVDGIFCHFSWQNITQLTITCKKTCHDNFVIKDNVFRCLDRLETLKIHVNKLTNFSKNTFSALPNVCTLDLSNCENICKSELITILSDRKRLPNLSKLKLEKIGVHCRPHYLEFNQVLANLMAIRNVSEISLSYNKILFDKVHLEDLCKSLTTFTIRNSDVLFSHKLNYSKICTSLRTVDMSGIRLTKSAVFPTQFNFTGMELTFDPVSPFYSGVSTFYFNHVLSDHVFFFLNTSLNLTSNNSLNELHLCDYNVPSLDIDFVLNHNYLKHLIISNNKIENIGPKVFRHLELLRSINLANNKLSRSRSFENTFSKLFQKNVLIEEINLSGNELAYLPRDTFLSNTLLKRLYLFGNRFQQITFEIIHLRNLNSLDIRHSLIEYLDTFSRHSLDALLKSQKQNKTENNTVLVDLRGNPLSCCCSSLVFLQWFVTTPVFSRTRQEYFCQASGGTFSVSENGVTQAKEDCERPKRRLRVILLASTIPSFIVIVTLTGVIVGFKRHKKRLAQQRFEDLVKLLQDDGTGFEFLAFVSYSSEDSHLVFPHVLLPLRVCTEVMNFIFLRFIEM